MLFTSLQFKDSGCFQSDWVGFEEVKPINVIIGRNNAGKSHLVDFVEFFVGNHLSRNREAGARYQLRLSGLLEAADLMRRFPPNTSGGDLRGNHWESYGRYLVGSNVVVEVNEKYEIVSSNASDLVLKLNVDHAHTSLAQRINLIALDEHRNERHILQDRIFRRLRAERDIVPEKPLTDTNVMQNGGGATNIIRRHLHSTNKTMSARLIQEELLSALNEIFGEDGRFTAIEAKEHDEGGGYWEIFLHQEGKGAIPLSKSGSGLKTVLLVLINILVIPRTLGSDLSGFVFAFEELENNLHPSLLRRLVSFIDKAVRASSCIAFLTTHSSALLDAFALTGHAQIMSIERKGAFSSTKKISCGSDSFRTIVDLGCRPSDILQANCIIWVEGPSDRVYINYWMRLLTDGGLVEGRDYQCVFYGGALLADVDFSFDPAEEALCNVLGINQRVCLVCDSDQAGPDKELKKRVQRVRKALENIEGAYMWITQVKEIENYIPGSVFARAYGKDYLRDPEKFEGFWTPNEKGDGTYVEDVLGRKPSKTDLALACVRAAPTLAEMSARFDWKERTSAMVEAIRRWNQG